MLDKVFKAIKETKTPWTHMQNTPYLKTIYFANYKDAENVLKWLWNNDRKTYYSLDAYYNHDRKKYYGSIKYKIFIDYGCYSNGDSNGIINEYHISWRN